MTFVPVCEYVVPSDVTGAPFGSVVLVDPFGVMVVVVRFWGFGITASPGAAMPGDKARGNPANAANISGRRNFITNSGYMLLITWI